MLPRYSLIIIKRRVKTCVYCHIINRTVCQRPVFVQIHHIQIPKITIACPTRHTIVAYTCFIHKPKPETFCQKNGIQPDKNRLKIINISTFCRPNFIPLTRNRRIKLQQQRISRFRCIVCNTFRLVPK